MPSSLHFVWCRGGYFTFQHYLSILSAVRLLQPVKVTFHYGSYPQADGDLYYTWFWELKQSLPGLVLQKHPDLVGSAWNITHPGCRSQEFLSTLLGEIQVNVTLYTNIDPILFQMIGILKN